MTPSEFKAFFPDGEFNSLLSDYIQTFLDRAAGEMNQTRWGNRYSDGLAYLTAHMIVVSKARASKALAPDAGDVTSKHVGAVGLTKDASLINLQAKEPLMRTTYGQEYLNLRRMVGIGGLVPHGVTYVVS